MIVIIDCFDSFVYNLDHYVRAYYPHSKTIRINEFLKRRAWFPRIKKLIISPGPQSPADYPELLEIIDSFHSRIPIFGVCLGLQAIAYYFNHHIIHAETPMHGKVSRIVKKEESILYRHIPDSFNAVRYHSLIVDPKTITNDFKIISESLKKEIMGIEHQRYPLYAVQYHPESILSEYGKEQIYNFLKFG